jgi:hypothetical protein
MKLAPFPFLVYTSVDLTQYLHMHHLHAKLELPVKYDIVSGIKL